MTTLNVAMIVKNEAHCLAECLESVRGIADEILIGDTGSTDTTLEVAHRCRATVLEVPWNDDFSEARNRVLEAASGDWLLHMDADEVLDPAGAKRIRELVDGDGLGADAIEVTLANYCDDPRAWRWVACPPGDPWARGFSGYIRVGLLRLFRNLPGYRYREPVHESITESVHEQGGRIRKEPILIHHYGYHPGSGGDTAKREFYLALGRKKVQERPHDSKAWHDLAEQLLACGDAVEAEKACRTALDLAPRHLGAATTMANLLLNRGDLDDARELFESLEAAGPVPPHVVTTLGAIAVKEGRLEEARTRLEAVLNVDPTSVLAALYLARVYDRLHRPEEARAALEKALATAPTLSELRNRLDGHRLRLQGETEYRSGEFRQALITLVEALRLDPDDPLTQNDLGVVLVALEEPLRARQCFERALLLAPGLPDALDNLNALS